MWISVLAGLATAATSAPADCDAMLPTTAPPIIYVINYSGDYFKRADYIERFQADPPDLLHVGKATPITHLWGPVRMCDGALQAGQLGSEFPRLSIADWAPYAQRVLRQHLGNGLDSFRIGRRLSPRDLHGGDAVRSSHGKKQDVRKTRGDAETGHGGISVRCVVWGE